MHTTYTQWLLIFIKKIHRTQTFLRNFADLKMNNMNKMTNISDSKYVQEKDFFKCCCQSRLDHRQSIERWIFISRLVETIDLDKYTKKMFQNNCFIDLEVGRLWMNLLFPVSCRDIFTSYVKMKGHWVWFVCKLIYEVVIMSTISGNVKSYIKDLKDRIGLVLHGRQFLPCWLISHSRQIL